MDNQEKLATYDAQDGDKQNKNNTICVWTSLFANKHK